MQENEKDKRNRTVDRYMKKNVTKMAGTPSKLRSFPFPNKSRSYKYYALHEIKCLLMFI